MVTPGYPSTWRRHHISKPFVPRFMSVVFMVRVCSVDYSIDICEFAQNGEVRNEWVSCDVVIGFLSRSGSGFNCRQLGAIKITYAWTNKTIWGIDKQIIFDFVRLIDHWYTLSFICLNSKWSLLLLLLWWLLFAQCYALCATIPFRTVDARS